MSLVKVYRYEDKYGVGPYNSSVKSLYSEIIKTKAHDNSKRPQMFDNSEAYEFREKHKRDGYCFAGCTSLKLLKRWFWGVNNVLLKNKFNLVEYTINEKYVYYCKDKLQVMFIKHKAKSKKIIA